MYRPLDQEVHDRLGTEKKNFWEDFLDHRPHTPIDSTAYCRLGGKHWIQEEAYKKKMYKQPRKTIAMC